MKKKKLAEMTVREFLQEAERRGAYEIVQDPNFGLVQVLRKEGFSDEEIYEIKMKKARFFWADSLKTLMLRMFDIIGLTLEVRPDLERVVQPHIERIKQMLKEFEEEEKE